MDGREPVSVGCLVMAAGNASRFAANKLTATFGGRTLIERALAAVPAVRFRQVTVVTQYPQVMQLARTMGFGVVPNVHPEYGISHTIALGMRTLMHCGGVLFQVADQPLLRRESVERILDVWQANPEQIVSAAHGGRRGNPCLFPRRFFDELTALDGDRGGSVVIRAHPEAVQLVELPALELADCDTPSALAALKRQCEAETQSGEK